MITGKKILITGGAGFIGSHLADAFLSCGNQVVALDNFSTGHRSNLLKASDHPNFTLIEGDIRDLDMCRTAAAGCDYILHEAAVGTVPLPVENHVETVAVNVSGFVNVLTAAKDLGIRRVVYASSSSVYGDNPDPEKVEERTGVPITPYAVTKVCDELLAGQFAQLYGTQMIGLRYFNVFGPRQDSEGPAAAVIPRFIKAMRAHEYPVIYGDGASSRDFTYVANVINANILALEAGDRAVNQVYNIACGESTTLNRLFLILRDILSEEDPFIAHLDPDYEPARKLDIPDSQASIRKAVDLLNFFPSYKLEIALRIMTRTHSSGVTY